jgi:hypothetical protein
MAARRKPAEEHGDGPRGDSAPEPTYPDQDAAARVVAGGSPNRTVRLRDGVVVAIESDSWSGGDLLTLPGPTADSLVVQGKADYIVEEA